MSDLTTIRTAIKTKMETVTDIGLVHDRERYAKKLSTYVAQFVDGDGDVLGWVIEHLSTKETSPSLGRYVVDHRWRIRGYMAFRDAASSAATFDDLIEDIRDAFRADETIGGAVATTITEQAAGLQKDDAGPVMFGGVLCHSTRLSLITRHYQ